MIAGAFKLGQLKPWLAGYAKQVVAALDSVGIGGTVYDVYRSPEDQEKRFAAGDSAAHAGQSPHQYGLAFDFVVDQGESSQMQLRVQQFWKYLGFAVLEKPIGYRGGTPLYDRAHVEMPNWRQFIG